MLDVTTLAPSDQLFRRALFTPCGTREHLQDWIRTFLDLDLPDCTVDPESNSNPIDLIWELYSKGMDGKDENFMSVLAYASRDSYKCVEKGTLIKRRDGLIPIEEIKVGDVIWSGWSWRPVTDWVHDGVRDGFRVVLESGAILTGSPIHRVWAKEPGKWGDWKRIPNLTPEDRVWHQPAEGTPTWEKVGVVEAIPAVDFYDLSVADDHSYWSNGLISHNTLSTSVMEILGLVHMNRDIAHVAAILQQSLKAVEYVGNFLAKPAFYGFVTTDNSRRVEFVRYTHRHDGRILTEREWKDLPPDEKAGFDRRMNYIHILVATVKSMNSEHVPFFVSDETDLADPRALQEGQMIPCVRDGKLPITFMTSTRKTAFGPVQKAIDNAEKSRLNIRHWNIVDVAESCPPERHRPEEGRIPIWVNRDLLSAKSDSDFQAMMEEDRKGYTRLDGYHGCLRNCRLFPACRGLLVDRQKSKSPLLKPLAVITDTFGRVDTETALAQLLCLKPTSEGLIYPHFSRQVHMRTAAEMASMMTGEAFPDSFGKMDLLKLAKERGFRIYAGLDHGFTHAFAVVTGILVGQNFYVVDCIEAPGLELAERIDICDKQIKWLEPIIYPDNEDPASIKTFRRHGYRMMDFKKDIMAGVNAVRWKLKPALGAPPQMYFLSGDRPLDTMLTKLAQYHWKYDASHQPMVGTPDDSDGDDAITALRYVCQNLFGNKGRVVTAPDTVSPIVTPGVTNPAPQVQDWMQSYLSGTLGLDVDYVDPEDGVVVGRNRGGEGTGRKGGFVWSMD